jgi:predicted transposase YdaD
MPKPFDATMRKLLELEPAAWLRFLHVPITDPGRVRVIDSNLSTVTAEADKVFWVDGEESWIEHVELQAGRNVDLPDSVHYYNTSLGRSHKVPVHSTIILLRPVADGPDINGLFERRDRNGDVYDWFRYHVVRIWEQPLAEVLAAGLPVLPLAPVADVEPAKVPDVLMTISERLVRETSPEQAATLWAATKVLMGLRYPKEQVEGFMRGASAMILGIRGIEESSVYQDIFAKGEAEGEAKGRVEGRLEGAVDEARETLLRQGRKKLGPPREAVEAQITALGDLERLNHLLDRILEVSTWDELLAPLFPSS